MPLDQLFHSNCDRLIAFYNSNNKWHHAKIFNYYLQKNHVYTYYIQTAYQLLFAYFFYLF